MGVWCRAGTIDDRFHLKIRLADLQMQREKAQATLFCLVMNSFCTLGGRRTVSYDFR